MRITKVRILYVFDQLLTRLNRISMSNKLTWVIYLFFITAIQETQKNGQNGH